MDSKDVIDNVNALLKLGVGDPYRLEHIKQSYILNSTIWKSDNKYLEQLREKYLVKHRIDQPDIQPEIDEKLESDSEDKDMIHCWKCGKKSPTRANFCMVCGSAIFEVGAEPKTADVRMPSNSKNQTKSIGLKIPIIIGIPVLILIIIGAGYTQGYFDNGLDSSSDTIPTPIIEDEDIFYGEFDSKCGAGTVLDPETNACRVGSVKTSSTGETDSKCGAGTVFDPDANSCVLGNAVESKDSTSEAIVSTETSSKCGAGTIFDSETHSCVLDK